MIGWWLRRKQAKLDAQEVAICAAIAAGNHYAVQIMVQVGIDFPHLYPILARLEETGKIRSVMSDGGRRRYYLPGQKASR